MSLDFAPSAPAGQKIVVVFDAKDSGRTDTTREPDGPYIDIVFAAKGGGPSPCAPPPLPLHYVPHCLPARQRRLWADSARHEG